MAYKSSNFIWHNCQPICKFLLFSPFIFSSTQDELLIVYEERHENRAVGPIFDTVAKYSLWLPRWLCGKNPPANAGDMGLIPGLGSYPGEGNGNPLWYSCLGNPMDRGAWWTTVHGVAKSQTQLSDWVCMHSLWGKWPQLSIFLQINNQRLEDISEVRNTGR